VCCDGKPRVTDLSAVASRLDTPVAGDHGVWANGVRSVDERDLVKDCGRPGRAVREFVG
jgi:hypothetical protein